MKKDLAPSADNAQGFPETPDSAARLTHSDEDQKAPAIHSREWRSMNAYPYLRGDGVPVAQPLFHEEGSGANPTSPLQFRFEPVTVHVACQLNALWHSRLPRLPQSNIHRSRFSACYAAVFGGAYYATAIWTNPVNRVLDDGESMELRRFAIGPHAPKNTASRMEGFMVRDIRKRFPFIKRLLSYQDTEAHTGILYRACGWVIDGISKGHESDSPSRSRIKVQSTADKVRWLKPLARTPQATQPCSEAEKGEANEQTRENTVMDSQELMPDSSEVTPKGANTK